MNVSNYLKKKLYNGQLVKIMFNDLHKKQQFTDVLFIRTPTTGGWMDDMLLDNSDINITRISYQPENGIIIANSENILEHSKLESHLTSLDKKFDLIILDPFHEYYESNKDLLMLPSFMTENGILICHDCFPFKKEYATSKFKPGIWSGVTYICFVELAYSNPEWWYAVFANDTGVGILSKQKLDYLEQNFDRTKQEQLIQMNKNNNDNTYDYYCRNSKSLINLIKK
jgi:hypothetical protein